jgi:hypothetical protein
MGRRNPSTDVYKKNGTSGDFINIINLANFDVDRLKGLNLLVEVRNGHFLNCMVLANSGAPNNPTG